MRVVLILAVVLSLSGCKLFQSMEGNATDDVVVTHTCAVNIAEASAIKGVTDADTMLYVEVKPDCTTLISTEQIEGDSVIKIEEQRTRAGSQPIAIPTPESPSLLVPLPQQKPDE